MVRVRVSVEVLEGEAVVRVGGDAVEKEWALFWALLAFRATGENPLVTVDQLRDYQAWSIYDRRKAGVKVSNKRKRKESGAFALLDASSKPCTEWALDPARTTVSLLPDAGAVGRWLEERRACLPSEAEVELLGRCVEAMIAWLSGDTARSRRVAAAVVEATSSDRTGTLAHAMAWAMIIEARSAVARDGDRKEERIEALRHKLCASPLHDRPLGRFVDARLLVALAMVLRADEGRASGLLQEMNRFEVDGTFAGRYALPDPLVGPLRNVQSVIERRRPGGRLHVAARLAVDAAWRFGLLGDLQSLQAALFNGALAVRPDGLDAPPPAQARLGARLLDACLEVCGAFALGRDSAEAELLRADYCCADGDVAGARRWVDAAADILANSRVNGEPSSGKWRLVLLRGQIAAASGDLSAAALIQEAIDGYLSLTPPDRYSAERAEKIFRALLGRAPRPRDESGDAA